MKRQITAFALPNLTSTLGYSYLTTPKHLHNSNFIIFIHLSHTKFIGLYFRSRKDSFTKQHTKTIIVNVAPPGGSYQNPENKKIWCVAWHHIYDRQTVSGRKLRNSRKQRIQKGISCNFDHNKAQYIIHE